ncbi:cystatin-like protein [Euroglyphus maynei]|uniref:Cystatin-like protein n=1 Tax=Euroglyphus maynei TaxID=6958 RepID=A0A1Y3AZB0_EURMA|nr:cystatin-like protein [Euroglyphus maynei]
MAKLIIISVLLVSMAVIGFAATIVGDFKEMDVNNEHLRESLSHLERQMDNQINSNTIHRIAKILKAEYQVVSGIQYRATFEFGETDCLKSDHRDVESCKFTGYNMICHATTLEQSWLKRSELIKFVCDN